MFWIFKKTLEDKDFSELIKGSGVSFILRFVGLALGYILTLLIANLFGAKGLGDYVLSITVLSLFTLFAKIGLDTTSIRFIASFSTQGKWNSIYYFRKKVVAILTVSSLTFSLIMYFMAPQIANLINTNILFIKLSAFFILPMAFFMLHYESLRGLKRIAEFSFFYRVSQALVSIIVIVILYQFTTNSKVPVYAYLTSVALVSLFSYLSFRYWLASCAGGKFTAEKEMLRYSSLLRISIPLMFAQTVQFVMGWTDKLMLGAMTTTEDVAIYYTAFKLSMFAAVALMSINSIAAPKFAELYAKNNLEGFKKVVKQSTSMIFWTSLPFVFVFFMFPKFFLGLFGPEFKVGVTAFLILSCGRLISSYSGPVGSILQMTDNQNIYGIILFFGAIINVSLNLFLIPINNPLTVYGISGINGAAIASMISLSFWNLSMIFVVKKKFGFYSCYIPFSNNEK